MGEKTKLFLDTVECEGLHDTIHEYLEDEDINGIEDEEIRRLVTNIAFVSHDVYQLKELLRKRGVYVR